MGDGPWTMDDENGERRMETMAEAGGEGLVIHTYIRYIQMREVEEGFAFQVRREPLSSFAPSTSISKSTSYPTGEWRAKRTPFVGMDLLYPAGSRDGRYP